MRKWMIFIAALVLTMVMPAMAIDVTGPTVITAPGTYVLQNDILGSSATIAIEIDSAGVTFDGNGHTIDGLDAANSIGIFVDDSASAVIKNVKLTDWATGIDVTEGDATIQDSTITSNGNGISIIDGHAQVFRNKVMSNTQHGVALTNTGGNRIAGNQIEGNPVGISIQYPSLWDSENTITGNSFKNRKNWELVNFPDPDSNTDNFWSNTPRYFLKLHKWIGGGNYWGSAKGRLGYSDRCTDADRNGFCDNPYVLADGNVDYYPLTKWTLPTATLF